MIHMSVLPEHMPLTDCLSYVYIVSKLGVLFQEHFGISTLILFRFLNNFLFPVLIYMSSNHNFPCQFLRWVIH